MNKYVLLTGAFSLALSTITTTTAYSQDQAQGATATVPAEPPAPKWESSAAAGLTLTRGNSKSVLATANIQTQKKTTFHEWLFGGDAAYGETDDVKNAETLHAFGQYNYLVSERTYGGLRLDGIHDGIADVDYRFTIAPLAGYFFIKEKMTTLKGEAGPAYVYQKQGGVTEGFFSLRLGERFEHKFNDKAKIWQSFEILPQVEDFNNFYFNAEIGVEAALTEKTSLRAFIQDTYYNVPAPGREKNDIKLVSAIAYKF